MLAASPAIGHPSRNCTPRRPLFGGPFSRWEILGVVLITLLATALRIFHLGEESLWLDEAFSWRWAHLSHGQIWSAAATLWETNPPLYYSIQRIFLSLGDGEATLRLPAMLAGIATVPLLWIFGRALAGPFAGLAAALLLTVSSTHVHYSQEARAYSLQMAAATLAIFGFIQFLRAYDNQNIDLANNVPQTQRGSELALVLYFIGCSIALYCHNTTPLLPLLANMVALVWWAAIARYERRFAVAWVVANVAVFCVWVWWLPTLLAQAIGAPNFSWIIQPTLSYVIRQTGGLYVPFNAPVADVAFHLLLLLLALIGLWQAPVRRSILLVLAVFVVAVPFLTWLVGELFRPIYIPRTTMWPLGIGLLLIAIAIASIKSRSMRLLMLAFALMGNLSVLDTYYRSESKPPWRAIIGRIRAESRPGDAVVLAPYATHWVWTYYARNSGNAQLDVFGSGVPDLSTGYYRVASVDEGITLLSADEMEREAPKFRRIWIVLYDPSPRWHDSYLERFKRRGTLTAKYHWGKKKKVVEVYLFETSRPE